MRIQIVLITPVGQYLGNPINMDSSEFEIFREKVKFFWKSGGFEMELEEGGFLVLPPNVTERSIIKIDILNSK